jgi:hypothetical protein
MKSQPFSASAVIQPSTWLAWLRALLAGAVRQRWRIAGWLCVLGLTLNCASSTIPADSLRSKLLEAQVQAYTFNFLTWETGALLEKGAAWLHRPSALYSPQAATALVKSYLARARQITDREDEVNRILSEGHEQTMAESARLLNEIKELRQHQETVRPAVEQIIEKQVSAVIAEAGIQVLGRVAPPVQFVFTEPPKKLIVSPRERISTIYGQMLDADMPLDAIEQAEMAIFHQQKLSAYITRVGGLGAYPSMVIDRASLYWVLSTVAHEWVHNYLTFFPLGINYGRNADLITMNETVAELAGDELGRRALFRFYPEEISSDAYPDLRLKDDSLLPPPPEFDFRREMGETRRTVDQLLFFGRVADAESYMEARRILFVENGHKLRRLNQAYFAFHGSYADSPAAPTTIAEAEPLAPKIIQLRKLTGDLDLFLRIMRGLTTVQELKDALQQQASASTTHR